MFRASNIILSSEQFCMQIVANIEKCYGNNHFDPILNAHFQTPRHAHKYINTFPSSVGGKWFWNVVAIGITWQTNIHFSNIYIKYTSIRCIYIINPTNMHALHFFNHRSVFNQFPFVCLSGSRFKFTHSHSHRKLWKPYSTLWTAATKPHYRWLSKSYWKSFHAM